jgi:gliding motility-associated-like protein
MIVKVFCSMLVLFFCQFTCAGQSGNWVWLKGGNLGGEIGNFGTKGVSAPTNEPPARYQTVYWSDLAGNYWVFGGVGTQNDLWRYTRANNEWTWIKGDDLSGLGNGNFGTKGVPSPLNDPPFLGWGANGWTDSTTGDLWLYGGFNTFTSSNDNVWRYNIANNEWTWMHGSGFIPGRLPIYGPKGVYGANFTPGGRCECKSGWFHNNALWMFGGQDSMNLMRNDIWSYSISTNQWAFEGGGQANNTLGNYGTKGVELASNEPPARTSYTKWEDNNNLYIFAGVDNFTGTTQLGLNDVWKYNKSSKFWTWVSGQSGFDNPEISSGYCNASINYIPQARLENQTAQLAEYSNGCTKAFWTFGGFNLSGTAFHNDLWLFNTDNLEWLKVKGQASVNGSLVTSSYGTKGVLSPTNLPTGRGGIGAWCEPNGELFIFGGLSNLGLQNDLWKFVPDGNCIIGGLIVGANLVPPTDSTLCSGDTIKMPVPKGVNINVTPTQGAIYDSVKNIIYFVGPITNTYTVTSSSYIPNDPCFLNDTVSFLITGFDEPDAAFIVSPKLALVGNGYFNLINTSQKASSFWWYDEKGNLAGTSRDLDVTQNTPGHYCYTLHAKNGCGDIRTAIGCFDVVDNASLVFPTAFSPNGDGKNDKFSPIKVGDGILDSYHFIIYNRWGAKMFETTDIKEGWDGFYKNQPSETAVYYYMATTTSPDGKKIVYKGDVTILH